MSSYSLYNSFNLSLVTGPAIKGPIVFPTAAAADPHIPPDGSILVKNSGATLLPDITSSIIF